MATVKRTDKVLFPEKPLSLVKEKTITLAHDFKEFIANSHAVDLAGAIIMGGSVTAIISSIVNDLLMPFISVIFGTNIRKLSIDVGHTQIAYGSFIQSTLNFLLVAWVLFLVVRAITRLRKELDKIDPKVHGR